MSPAVAHSKHDLAAAERTADAKLLTCRRVAAAVDGVVDSLSGAGSGLQRTLHEVLGGPDGLELALASEDPLIQQAAFSAFRACSGIGAALTGFAAALSGELQQPLHDLERAVTADRAQRAQELEELRRKHQACTGALTESLRRKERLSSDLRVALDECEQEKGKPRRFSWLGKPNNAGEAESRLQQVMVKQTTAVEEFGACVEQAVDLSNSAQQGTEALAEALWHVDFAMKQTLHTSLRRCSIAWKAVAGTLTIAAQQLSDDSARVVADARPPAECDRAPSWARGLLKPTSGQCNTAGSTDCADPKAGATKLAVSQRRDVEQAIQGTPSPVRRHQEPEMDANTPKAAALADGWAELEAQKKAFQESQETREIQLLEQEESLRGMKAELDTQMEQVAERRRSLAVNQAHCIALLETPSQVRHGAECFKLDAAPPRSPDPANSLNGDEDDSVQMAESNCASDDEDKEVNADDVWDMDWTLARTASGTLLQEPDVKKEPVLSPEVPEATAVVADAAEDAPAATAQEVGPAPEVPDSTGLRAAATEDAAVATAQEAGPAAEAGDAKQAQPTPAEPLEFVTAAPVPEEAPGAAELGSAAAEAAPAAAAQEAGPAPEAGDALQGQQTPAEPTESAAAAPAPEEAQECQGQAAAGATEEDASQHGALSASGSSAPASPCKDKPPAPWASQQSRPSWAVPRHTGSPKQASVTSAGQPSGDDGSTSHSGPAEFQALRERMRQKRDSRDQGHTPRSPHKEQMPGVHPDIAEKLLARRRLVDAMEATSSDTSPH